MSLKNSLTSEICFSLCYIHTHKYIACIILLLLLSNSIYSYCSENHKAGKGIVVYYVVQKYYLYYYTSVYLHSVFSIFVKVVFYVRVQISLYVHDIVYCIQILLLFFETGEN